MSRRLAGAALGLALLAGGCASLPESGPVVRETASASAGAAGVVPFQPPGPGRGDSPGEIVTGFLTAMQASPRSTSVARSFLARSARSTWEPDRSTIVYEGSAVDVLQGGVRVRLGDASRLDSRGGWAGSVTGADRRLGFRLTREGGQWRITNPPNALVLPLGYFESRFRPYNLYFFDQSQRVLVPDRVYLPQGEESTSNLVRSLLAGPGRQLARVTRTEFPPQTELDLSVLLSPDGTAEVPLSEPIRNLPPAWLTRAVAQLQYTLRQVPSLTRLRINVDDEPLALPSGRVEVRLNGRSAFSVQPRGSSPTLFGLRKERLVSVRPGQEQPVRGPFGDLGFALRSFGVDLAGRRVAAVADNGRAVFVGPMQTGGPRAVRRVYEGTDVLKPSFDMFGDAWLVDRTGRGARVVLVRGRRSTVVDVAGISGADVRAGAVSRDGTRLAAVVGRPGGVQLVVAQLQRTAEGAFSRGAGSAVGALLTDLGTVTGMAWRSSNDLVLLHQVARRTAQLSLLTSDGSPGDPAEVLPDTLRGQGRAVAGSPTGAATMVLMSSGTLMRLEPSGLWEATSVAPGLSSPTYVG